MEFREEWSFKGESFASSEVWVDSCLSSETLTLWTSRQWKKTLDSALMWLNESLGFLHWWRWRKCRLWKSRTLCRWSCTWASFTNCSKTHRPLWVRLQTAPDHTFYWKRADKKDVVIQHVCFRLPKAHHWPAISSHRSRLPPQPTGNQFVQEEKPKGSVVPPPHTCSHLCEIKDGNNLWYLQEHGGALGKKRKTSQRSREQQEVSVHTSLQTQLMLNYSDLQREPDIEGQRAIDIQIGDGEQSRCPAIFFILSSSGSGSDEDFSLIHQDSQLKTKASFSLWWPFSVSVGHVTQVEIEKLPSPGPELATLSVFSLDWWMRPLCSFTHHTTDGEDATKLTPAQCQGQRWSRWCHCLWEKPPQETHYCLATDFPLMTMTWFFFNGYFVLQSCDLNGDVESQSFEEEFVGGASRSRVRLMANQLQAKLHESSSTCRTSSSAAAADFRRQVRACWFLMNHIDFWWSNRGCGHDVCTINVSINANTLC